MRWASLRGELQKPVDGLVGCTGSNVSRMTTYSAPATRGLCGALCTAPAGALPYCTQGRGLLPSGEAAVTSHIRVPTMIRCASGTFVGLHHETISPAPHAR